MFMKKQQKRKSTVYIIEYKYKKTKKHGTCQCNFPVVSPGNTSQHLKVANALTAHLRGAFI